MVRDKQSERRCSLWLLQIPNQVAADLRSTVSPAEHYVCAWWETWSGICGLPIACHGKPQVLPHVRVQWSSGRVVALEWLSLQRFLVRDQGSQGDLANARAFLQTCSSQEVTAMVEAGVQCCYHEIQSGDLLCLPPGWLIAEQTCSVSSNGFQATFLYGSRQTRCALLPLMHMAPPENTSPQVAEGVKLMKAALAALEVSGGLSKSGKKKDDNLIRLHDPPTS